MEEAQRLADHVAIIDGGRLIGEGPPGGIGGDARSGARIVFALPAGMGAQGLPEQLSKAVDGADGRLELHSERPVEDLALLCG